MFKELLFKDDLTVLVLSNEKTVTSRLTTNLNVNDVFYVEDTLFVVRDVTKKRIDEVDYVSESFTSTQQLLDVLNDIYYVNLKRVDHELTVNDVMYVVTFETVNVVK
jgi:tartrate dehydratase beta subunit/fumarate hydratase class I family protein